MRLSVVLLLCSLAGVVGGAALIGRWALGAAVIADSVLLGLYALGRDDGSGRQAPPAHEVTTLESILERARRAS